MSPRLISEPCPLCAETNTVCPLCQAQVDMAHDEARRAEGLRLALAFAEMGYALEVRDVDPDRTLPREWTEGL